MDTRFEQVFRTKYRTKEEMDMSRVMVYRTDRELRNYRRKIRRQKEIRRNIILALVCTLILIFFGITFHSFTSLANTDQSDVAYKYFTTIQVEEGDSLWSIAESYMDNLHYDSANEYIKEIMCINKLHEDMIVCGQYLVIPYYSYKFY